MSNIVVTGGYSGLGKLICEELREIVIGDHEEVNEFDLPDNDVRHPGQHAVEFDARILVNCAGINELSAIEDIDESLWYKTMDVNCLGVLKMVQVLQPQLIKNQGTILNIISDAAIKPMTNSLCYNASKAALQMMTLQMARELGPKGITVFGISPNRLRGTPMSDDVDKQVSNLRGWSIEETRRRQAMRGEETDPAQLAEFIGYLLSDRSRHKYFHGCIIPYGA